MLPLSLRLNCHAHAVSALNCANHLNRSAKIGHIQLPTQAFRKTGFQELHNQLVSLLTNIDSNLITIQIDNNPSSILYATPKINIFQRSHTCISAFRKNRAPSFLWRRRLRGGSQRHQ